MIRSSSDIFAGQPADPDLLARIYDLEHDEVVEDLPFYRQLTRRIGGRVLDLGCGSGRLFRSFLDGHATAVAGVDGSAALLRRARLRIEHDEVLARAAVAGRLSLTLGDVRHPPSRGRYRLIVAAGVLPHLDGPEDALRMLTAARRRLGADGTLVLDDIGPGELPQRELPLSLDWTRELDGQPVVRRSRLEPRESPEGLRVEYFTLTDTVRADGTIARLPATFRLWYPSQAVLEQLLDEAGFTVELAYGSYDLEPPGSGSPRRIVTAQAAA